MLAGAAVIWWLEWDLRILLQSSSLTWQIGAVGWGSYFPLWHLLFRESNLDTQRVPVMPFMIQPQQSHTVMFAEFYWLRSLLMSIQTGCGWGMEIDVETSFRGQGFVTLSEGVPMSCVMRADGVEYMLVQLSLEN